MRAKGHRLCGHLGHAGSGGGGGGGDARRHGPRATGAARAGGWESRGLRRSEGAAGVHAATAAGGRVRGGRRVACRVRGRRLADRAVELRGLGGGSAGVDGPGAVWVAGLVLVARLEHPQGAQQGREHDDDEAKARGGDLIG